MMGSDIIDRLDHWRQLAVTGDLQDTLAETIAEIRRLREMLADESEQTDKEVE